MGANRGGKSDALAFCAAKLARFGLPKPKISFCGDGIEVTDKATSGWVISQDFPSSRDIIQPKLFNNSFSAPGSHEPFIPEREVEKWDVQAQILKLKCGSLIGFKSCDSGPIKFAGTERDWVAFDEEAPEAIYDEATIRIGAGRRLRVFGACTLIPDVTTGRSRGVSWMFRRFIKPHVAGTLKGIKLFSLSIYDNPHLAKEDIDTLERKFPAGTIQHKIRLLGELVDEFAGARAYALFTPKIHVVPQMRNANLPLIWTWDFNVEPLTSLVGQFAGGVYRVIKELIVDIGNTYDMVSLFRSEFPLHGNEIWVYGDASGRKRTDQTAKSTYTLIQELMQDYPVPLLFKVPDSNPADIHRVNAINRLLKVPVSGEVRLQIDPSCAELIADLEEVVHSRDGGIKKTYNRKDSYAARTHTSDALGYWLGVVAPTFISVTSKQAMAINIPRPTYGKHALL